MILFFIAGILLEGLGSFLDGMFGTGNGTTSTSVNVGVVGITKVKSVDSFSLDEGNAILLCCYSKNANTNFECWLLKLFHLQN